MSTDLALLLAMEPPLAFLHHIPLYMALALLHLPIVTHLDLESDDPEPDRERAPSPTPTVPGYVPSMDPAIADHRNRPWPPADDRTLIRFKLDSKSRPSWKTIASRMNRTTDSCQARWQWLKNTNSPLLNPETPDENQAADD